ncbi:hypothetical protein EJB05_44966, partial [Eragrostis curvula]
MDSLGSYCLLAFLPLLYLIKSYLSPAYPGLRLPPGPWQLPIIGSLHHLRGGLLHRVMGDLSKRYGPLMFLKIGEVPVVVASSREAAREILKTHDTVFATRPQTPTVKLLSEGSPGLALAPYGEQWRQFRRICMVELLSAKRVQSFRTVREDEALRLVRSVSSSPTPLVNLGDLLSTYVLDISVRCIMGDRFKERDTFLRQLEKDMELLGGFSLTDIFPSSRLVQALSSAPREAEAHHNEVLKLMDGVLSEHMEKRSSKTPHRDDFIDVLVRIQREEGTLSTGAIKGLIHDLFSAGGETATVLLQWIMAELMRNPDAMTKAQDEVRAVFSKMMKVTEEGLTELSYLRCVINEALRLHPPGGFLIPRESREQCRILGYDVPKGATVMINIWAISRDREYWDEPEVFRPERFEESKIDLKGNDFEFTPFGAGRRICPGISFALANIELALANMLFYFKWSLPDGVSCTDVDMTEAAGLVNRRKSPLYLKATPCQPLPS